MHQTDRKTDDVGTQIKKTILQFTSLTNWQPRHIIEDFMKFDHFFIGFSHLLAQLTIGTIFQQFN